jgi:hypothetical protein
MAALLLGGSAAGRALVLIALVAFACALLLSARPGAYLRTECVRLGLDPAASRSRALVDLDGLSPDEPRWQQHGAGVLLFAYAEDARLLGARIAAAVACATRLRALSPWLRVALATNGDAPAGVFAHVVAIEQRHLFSGGDPAARDGAAFRPVESQALTRIYYLARSPFALTLALGSDAVACGGGVDALLRDELSASRPAFDLAYSPLLHASAGHASSTLLLRAGPATRALLRDWFVHLLNTDPTGDPTPALVTQLDRRLGAGALRRARLDASFAAAVRPASLVRAALASPHEAARGLIHILLAGGRASASGAELDELCGLVNQNASTPRLIVANRAVGPRLRDSYAVVALDEPLTEGCGDRCDTRSARLASAAAATLTSTWPITPP